MITIRRFIAAPGVPRLLRGAGVAAAAAGLLLAAPDPATAEGLRQSSNYAVQFDTLGGGGGIDLSSSSYQQNNGGAAHDFPWTEAFSSSYSSQDGGILWWGSFVPVSLSRFSID